MIGILSLVPLAMLEVEASGGGGGGGGRGCRQGKGRLLLIGKVVRRASLCLSYPLPPFTYALSAPCLLGGGGGLVGWLVARWLTRPFAATAASSCCVLVFFSFPLMFIFLLSKVCSGTC